MPEFFKGIGAARIGAMAGVAAALTGFFLYVFGLIAEPQKAILFSGLEARDASAVVAKLDALSVPYEQKGDGGTILIPTDQVTKIRMQLATDGLPSAGVGYEIFDKTDTFGTTTANTCRSSSGSGGVVASVNMAAALLPACWADSLCESAVSLCSLP